jgi:hypothetical protein
MAAGSRKGVGGLICAMGVVTSASRRGLGGREGCAGGAGAGRGGGRGGLRDAGGMRQGRGRQNVHRLGVWTPTLGL